MTAPRFSSSYAHGSEQSLGGGAKSSKIVVDWDEEVVPALKKRLAAAEDSQMVEEPLTSLHIDQTRMPSGRMRPAPKQNQYDEIIQDGLGNDELIPSEWATGSKARFLTAKGRNDRHAYSQQDSSRSVSDSYAQSRSVHHDAYNHDDTTFHNIDYASSRGSLVVEDSRGSRETMQNSTSAMLRASSNPSLLYNGKVLRQVDPNTPEYKENDRDTQDRTERLRSNSQGSAVLLKNGSPSRIPTLKPGGMPSGQKLESPTSRSRAAGTSSTLPQSKARSNLQHSPSSQQSRQRTVSTSSAKRTPSKRTEYLYNDVPVSQEVLDEFGPLGGTPSKAASYEAEETMATDEFGMPRSSSNPWDEELLPTVKRRLAQQAMMSNGGSRLSGVDGLVDTWDKNGMPLSTRSITPRKSSIRDVSIAQSSNELQESNEFQPRYENEPHSAHDVGEKLKVVDRRSQEGTSQERPNTAASERLKRLTEQLDFGFQSIPTTEERNKLDQQENDVEKNEISANSNSDVKPAEREARRQQHTQEHSNKQHQHQETKEPKADLVDRDQDVGAGCCKCTVM